MQTCMMPCATVQRPPGINGFSRTRSRSAAVARNPRFFVSLSGGIQTDERVQRVGSGRLTLENERRSADRQKPESAGDENVLQQSDDLGVRGGCRVFADRLQKQRIRGALVSDQVPGHLKHAR